VQLELFPHQSPARAALPAFPRPRRVLSLCDRTGIAVRPWLAEGWECTIVDLAHPPGRTVTAEGIITIGADVRTWEPAVVYDRVFAWPPCTDLASSGARWFRQKGLRALADALDLVAHVQRIIAVSGTTWWMLENPVGRLSTCWRPPDHTFNPCEYGRYLLIPGDAYTKRTCLWTSKTFVMPATKAVPPSEGSKMWRLPPSPLRAALRSATPSGFATAVWEANRSVPGEALTKCNALPFARAPSPL
jgi:hypothetical protein